MKYSEINKKFTEKVAEYISNGYAINSGTMMGTQSGDIAHVDLTDGNDIVRIRLEKTYERDNDYYDYIALIVSRKIDNAHPNMYWAYHTLWNNELEVVSEERFYFIGQRERFFGTKEEAKASMDKHYERLLNRGGYVNKDITSLKTAKAALHYVRKQPRCKSVKISDITVRREVDSNGSAIYRIFAKNHQFVISNGKGYKVA